MDAWCKFLKEAIGKTNIPDWEAGFLDQQFDVPLLQRTFAATEAEQLLEGHKRVTETLRKMTDAAALLDLSMPLKSHPRTSSQVSLGQSFCTKCDLAGVVVVGVRVLSVQQCPKTGDQADAFLNRFNVPTYASIPATFWDEFKDRAKGIGREWYDANLGAKADGGACGKNSPTVSATEVGIKRDCEGANAEGAKGAGGSGEKGALPAITEKRASKRFRKG